MGTLAGKLYLFAGGQARTLPRSSKRRLLDDPWNVTADVREANHRVHSRHVEGLVGSHDPPIEGAVTVENSHCVREAEVCESFGETID